MNTSEMLSLFRELGKTAQSIIGDEKNRISTSERNSLGQISIKADLEIERAVKRKLLLLNHWLITEEEMEKKNEGAEYIFVMDPLDGSKNYAHGYSPYFFGICGMRAKPSPTLADIEVSYARNLLTHDEYYSLKGKGAFLNKKQLNPSAVNNDELLFAVDLANIAKAERRSRICEGLFKLGFIRISGACIADMCHASSGALDAFVDTRNFMHITHASGMAIALESGAIVTDADGKRFNAPLAQDTRASIIIAKNKELHKKIMELIS
ncbi:MAG: inositol monophosphatase family protein [Candidatus Micrarchaeota archaeon]